MSSTADRASKVRRVQAAAKAKQIRADLAYRKEHDEAGVYENLAAHYRELGYGLDGYPLDYPQALKTLD